MMKHLFTTCLALLCAGITSCSNRDPNDSTESPAVPEVEARARGLQAAPADPLTPASIPSDKPTSINGKRPSRYTLEPHAWQSCTAKTTAACTTGSGGLGAACGISTPCSPDFICVNNFCKRLGNLNEACTSNFECVSSLACISSLCKVRSLLLGPCDEATDCQLPVGEPGPAFCINSQCRVPGDLGAPCQNNLHCKATSSSGQQLLCIIPQGQTVGTCNALSGPGGPCSDETQCNQSTAPRCVPTVSGEPSINDPRVCSMPGSDGAYCDNPADCNQAVSGGRQCNNGVCRTTGTVGTACTINTNCINGLVCINNSCNSVSNPGGACDENGDCSQTQAQRCINRTCQVTGLLNAPCGLNQFCATNTQCVFGGNPNGAMVCVNDVCKCPSSDTCQDNSQCPNTSSGEQQVCVPRLSPETGKRCRPAGTTVTGCCDEKADCRPINNSTCLLGPSPMGCNSGGVCADGQVQGTFCTGDDQCKGVLVCRKNQFGPYPNNTTCEYPL